MPRQIRDTSRPVRPSFTYSTVPSPSITNSRHGQPIAGPEVMPDRVGPRSRQPAPQAWHSCRMTGKRTRRVVGAAAAAGVAALVAWAVRDIPGQMGAQRTVTRGERVRRSPRFRDGVFHNPDPGASAAISAREAAALLREA